MISRLAKVVVARPPARKMLPGPSIGLFCPSNVDFCPACAAPWPASTGPGRRAP